MNTLVFISNSPHIYKQTDMNLLTKIFWALGILIWLMMLIVLIIALTDIISWNPFKEYRFIIAIGFIATSGFIRNAYKNRMNTRNV